MWNILWSSTPGGRYDTQPCSGDGATGMYLSLYVYMKHINCFELMP